MDKDKQILFLITASQNEDIRRVVLETGMSISELCRRAIDAYIKRFDEVARSQIELLPRSTFKEPNNEPNQ